MSCLSKGLLRSSAMLSILAALTAGSIGLPSRAFALSELKPAQNTEGEPQAQSGEQQQRPQAPEPDEIEGDSDGIPLPDPLVDRSAGQSTQQPAKPGNTPEMSVVIEHDISKAPEAVRKLASPADHRRRLFGRYRKTAAFHRRQRQAVPYRRQ